MSCILVADCGNHRVMCYAEGEFAGEVVAGGNGPGNRLDQLNRPNDVTVERDGAILVMDSLNHRIVRPTPAPHYKTVRRKTGEIAFEAPSP